MEQILYAKTYQEYKAELDTELSKTAEGFVRIGYLLKVARDTNVLADSPYQTVTEFAKSEYGIDKTMVSRFISINDRFSEGGYSDQLQDQFKGYGYAKLTLMLSLPDEINQELSPAYSKAEIQAIKDEVDAEKAISDLEVMMEPRPVPAPVKGLLNMLIYQLGEDNPELYVQMTKIMDLGDMQEWIRKAKETMAPDAEKQYSIRISGTGRFLVSIRENEDTITVTALRTLDKHCYTYQEFQEAWEEILPPTGTPDTNWSEQDLQNAWEDTYNREYPGKVKVAPVQQPEKSKKTESKPAPRKESRVQKATKPVPDKEPPAEEKQPAQEPEKPESTGTEETVNETDTNCVRLEETPESTSTEEQTGIEAADSETVTNCHQLQPEEQLPGQIGIEEAIKETEEKNRATSYIEQDIELDVEWEKKKNTIDMYAQAMTAEGTTMSENLSILPSRELRLLRKELIDMAVLIEKEFLRRGEEF